MDFKKHKGNSGSVIEVTAKGIILSSVQDALDIMANVDYQLNCRKIILHKENISENFFDLKTRIAGEILQKFSTYNVRLGIVGDFTHYQSKSLRDFIYECNNNKKIMFLPNVQSVLDNI